ncbi:MAG: copper homeostasis membrane protein CopD, partial [Stellaceae bacterium]
MDWLLITARAVHFAACVSLAGVLAFECLIAGPVLRRSDGFAASGLNQRLRTLAWASLTLTLISGAAWLDGVAASMSGKPLGAALSPGVLGIVLDQTRVGQDWLLRLALAVALGACLAARNERRARYRTVIAWLAFGLSTLILASLAWAGHGAATVGAPGELHLAGDILHLIGAGLWLGTLIPLELLLGEARRAGDTPWLAVARTAARRYSVLAVTSVTALLAGGLINTWFLAGTIPALIGTLYGRLLLAKIALFVIMLVVAAFNLLRLTPRLDDDARAPRTIVWLQRNALIETAIGLGVVAIVGVLGILPPGLHMEPGWPFPFRIDFNLLTTGAKITFAVFAIGFCASIVTIVVAVAAGWKRLLGPPIVGLIVCIAFGGAPLRSGIEFAYPTTFYAPRVPYDAPSVVDGAHVYAANCVMCHGADGRG